MPSSWPAASRASGAASCVWIAVPGVLEKASVTRSSTATAVAGDPAGVTVTVPLKMPGSRRAAPGRRTRGPDLSPFDRHGLPESQAVPTHAAVLKQVRAEAGMSVAGRRAVFDLRHRLDEVGELHFEVGDGLAAAQTPI